MAWETEERKWTQIIPEKISFLKRRNTCEKILLIHSKPATQLIWKNISQQSVNLTYQTIMVAALVSSSLNCI